MLRHHLLRRSLSLQQIQRRRPLSPSPAARPDSFFPPLGRELWRDLKSMAPTTTVPKRRGDEDRDTSNRWWCLRRGRGGPSSEAARKLGTSRGGFELVECEDPGGCTLELMKGAVVNSREWSAQNSVEISSVKRGGSQVSEGRKEVELTSPSPMSRPTPSRASATSSLCSAASLECTKWAMGSSREGGRN